MNVVHQLLFFAQYGRGTYGECAYGETACHAGGTSTLAKTGLVIAIIATAASLLMLLALLVRYWRRKK